MYRFADCQGFGGGFTVGATLAGFQLVAKREKPGGFGTPLLEANRAFLGSTWDAQACEPVKWDVPAIHADVVIGTPPCSAFSGMTSGYAMHGVNSPVNECMWDLMRYAARLHPAAVIMESVSQAYTNGAVLMHALAKELCQKSGLAYRTTHVLQDNYSLGGVTKRRRYFLVLSQVPFGVEVPQLSWLPMVGDAIGDLRDQKLTWDPQPYITAPTWWSHDKRSLSGVIDGHAFSGDKRTARLTELVHGLIEAGEPGWQPGEIEENIPRRYYEKFGYLPESWQYQTAGKTLTRDKQLLERDFKTGGFSQTKYWHWDRPGRVINGAGPFQIWHPDMRHATHREVARLMGFPDDWRCGTLSADRKLHSYWGKGTSVAPAEWIMTWLRASLDGSPGSDQGQPQPDGSCLIDVSKHWQAIQKRLESPPALSEMLPARAPLLTVPVTNAALATEVQQRLEAEIATRKRQRREARETKPDTPRVSKPRKPQDDSWKSLLPDGFEMRPVDEPAVKAVFRDRLYRGIELRATDTILDLGAHTGAFAVWAWQQKHYSKLVAVEMVPHSAAILRKNTASLPVTTVEGAAWGNVKDMAHVVLSERMNPMRASILATRFSEADGKKKGTFEVSNWPLPSLISDYHPAVIKFSLEGSESWVLIPHAQLFAKLGVRQLIGVHHSPDDRLLERTQQLHDALTGAGYRASRPAPAKISGWPVVISYTLT
jgi:FkbM family methyltransferase